MDRRGFLRALGLGVAAAAAPTKAYSFLGGILRPRPASYTWETDWVYTYKLPSEPILVWKISEESFRTMNPHLLPDTMNIILRQIRQTNEIAYVEAIAKSRSPIT